MELLLFIAPMDGERLCTVEVKRAVSALLILGRGLLILCKPLATPENLLF
jgi:hypothetical protein